MTLQADALTLTLGGSKVLSAVDATFSRGQVTAILGPNGAGKSSLLACLAGLWTADSGSVQIDGAPRSSLNRRLLAQKIGFLPQTADIHWDIDVETLVFLGRFPHRGRWGDSEPDHAAVEAAMLATDIGHLRHRQVNLLSGGERGRVLLARVLAGTPEWLLADEPLASLDPAHQLDVLDCLRQIAAQGAGVIVVLHDINQAARVADRVILMKGGCVIAHGAPDEILTRPLLARTYGVKTRLHRMQDGQRFIVTTGRVGS